MNVSMHEAQEALEAVQQVPRPPRPQKRVSKPRTYVSATPRGRRAFEDHVTALEAMMRGDETEGSKTV